MIECIHLGIEFFLCFFFSHKNAYIHSCRNIFSSQTYYMNWSEHIVMCSRNLCMQCSLFLRAVVFLVSNLTVFFIEASLKICSEWVKRTTDNEIRIIPKRQRVIKVLDVLDSLSPIILDLFTPQTLEWEHIKVIIIPQLIIYFWNIFFCPILVKNYIYGYEWKRSMISMNNKRCSMKTELCVSLKFLWKHADKKREFTNENEREKKCRKLLYYLLFWLKS